MIKMNIDRFLRQKKLWLKENLLLLEWILRFLEKFLMNKNINKLKIIME